MEMKTQDGVVHWEVDGCVMIAPQDAEEVDCSVAHGKVDHEVVKVPLKGLVLGEVDRCIAGPQRETVGRVELG